MKSQIGLTCLLTCLLLLAVPVMAEEPATAQEPEQGAEWLTHLVGQWNVEAPGAGTGRMNCSMLGNHWLVNDMEMEGSGFSVRALQTIGYDPEKKRYIGTWVDSMNAYLWHYEGELDESGKKLILEAEGPNLTDPSKISRYRDAYEFKSPDHIVGTSSIQGEDGGWTTFMTTNVYRAKDGE